MEYINNNWPIPLLMQFPGLNCYYKVISPIWLLTFYIRFDSDSVEVFMKAIEHEINQLLAVMLVVNYKLRCEFLMHTFKSSRRVWSLLSSLWSDHKPCKLFCQSTPCSQYIISIKFILVPSTAKIINKWCSVEKTL